MQIRPIKPADLDMIDEIDATIESSDYLHVERAGEGLSARFAVECRPLCERKRQPHAVTDELRFGLKQVAGAVEEGLAVLGEHDDVPIALVLAMASLRDPEVIEIIDLRVDFDHRRQGLGSMLLFQVINFARDRGARAVLARAQTNNPGFNRLLSKLSFELAGLDLFHASNHDLVKEQTTLLWYLPLT
jgi:GNAT superfamily N-acetyltransferase